MILYAQVIDANQPVPQLPPHKKQACADSKRESKMTKINFPVAHITEF
jgi:hypothetical protein